MTFGREGGSTDNGVKLAAQIWDRARRPRVGRGGEQTNDAKFTDDAPVMIEAFESDVIHVHATMHARAHIGFGDDENLGLVQEGEYFRRHRDQLTVALQDA
jgi:hypothetical protein